MGLMDKVLAAASAKDIETLFRAVVAKIGALGITDERRAGAAIMARQMIAEMRERKAIGAGTELVLEGCVRDIEPATDGKG